MTRVLIRLRALFSTALLIACSATPEAQPRLGGGGVGEFAGHLTVFVVDGSGGAGLAGASVRLDDRTGTTDADGRVDFDVASYDRIEVAHGGITERWVGLAAAVVTVPLALEAAPEEANLTGRLELGGLAPENPEHHLAAVVSASHARALDRDPPSAPVSCADASDCEFAFRVVPSSRRVFAEVLELDASDAVVSVRALFLSPPTAVDAGDSVAVVLSEVDAPIAIDVDAPTGADGFDQVVGVPGATLGDDVLVFGEQAMGLPRLLPSGSTAIWAVASGRSARGESRSIVRTDAMPESLSMPSLTALPDAELASGEVGLPAAAYRVLRAGSETVRVFDARPSVRPPAGDAVEVELTEVELGPDDVSLDDIERDWVHRVRVTL